MIDPKDDGVYHINVYSKGATEIGRFLSNFADCNVATENGNFRTVEGYWYWLSVENKILREKLRLTNGWESKTLGRKLRGKDWVDTPDFQEKILRAITTKVLSRPDMAQLMKESSLPFYHYYLYNDKVIAPNDGLWILTFLEHLRNELKEGII